MKQWNSKDIIDATFLEFIGLAILMMAYFLLAEYKQEKRHEQIMKAITQEETK